MAKKKKPKAKQRVKRKPPNAGKGTPGRSDEREEIFILEYVKDQNAARAARAAGYSEHSAKEIGYEVLTRPHVKQRVLNEIAALKERVKLEADEILLGIKHLAVSDPRRLCNLETGCVLPMKEWPDDIAQCVASFEVIEKFHPFTGELTGYVKKFKLWDKPKSQENLGRNQGLFKDVQEHKGAIGVTAVDEKQVKDLVDKVEKDF